MSKLFQPIQVGAIQLQHRVVMAPLTRMKATGKSHVPYTDLVTEHYVQRSIAPGTLIIAEGTLVARKAGTYCHVPGVWSQDQIDAWKIIVNGIHEKKSFIFSQLWAIGRASDIAAGNAENPPVEYVGPSAVALKGRDIAPRALTVDEIKGFVQSFGVAATNAVEKAGFDGVEIHGAHGYLVDQFIQDGSNKRTDQYGGSIENRSRFALEVLDVVVAAVGQDRTGIRLSPWTDVHDTLMADPIPTFSYLVSQIKARFPNLAYLHVVEPRVDGGQTNDRASFPEEWSNDFIREIWGSRPLISAGGYNRKMALEAAETTGDLIAFGRHFISNPDLVKRLKDDIPLNAYDRSTFYIPGDSNPSRGYTDYPFAS